VGLWRWLGLLLMLLLLLLLRGRVLALWLARLLGQLNWRSAPLLLSLLLRRLAARSGYCTLRACP
jgi:hypothetical protein